MPENLDAKKQGSFLIKPSQLMGKVEIPTNKTKI
jgi:hypothetical protein